MAYFIKMRHHLRHHCNCKLGQGGQGGQSESRVITISARLWNCFVPEVLNHSPLQRSSNSAKSNHTKVWLVHISSICTYIYGGISLSKALTPALVRPSTFLCWYVLVCMCQTWSPNKIGKGWRLNLCWSCDGPLCLEGRKKTMSGKTLVIEILHM